MSLIRFLKFIDWHVGRRICRLLPSAASIPPQSRIRSLLVIRPGGIGDAVLLISMIRALLKEFPNCRIDILAEKRNAAAFSLSPAYHTIYRYDTLSGLFLVLRNRYDAVIDTEQWYRFSAVVARLVRAPVKIGFGTNERGRMFSHDICYEQDAYEADNFLALLKPLGGECQRDDSAPSLKLPPESLAKADLLLLQLAPEPFVVLFPGSSIPEKRWGAERFCSVARQLEEEGYRVVVVGGQGDRADGEKIAGTAGLNLAGITTLTETAAVIARSGMVICGDSGVLHIAAGLGISTVSLFGPSCERKWAPMGRGHAALNSHLPCSPCSKYGTIPPCPINVRCMKEISPDAVLEVARRLLSQPPE